MGDLVVLQLTHTVAITAWTIERELSILLFHEATTLLDV
jgi:hypothetical protein